MQKHASILSKMLVSEISQCLQRAVSSFLPLPKMRQARYSIHMKLLQHYWRCMLNTFCGYLEELYCINYLWVFAIKCLLIKNLPCGQDVYSSWSAEQWTHVSEELGQLSQGRQAQTLPSKLVKPP